MNPTPDAASDVSVVTDAALPARATWRVVLQRALYWLPVFVAMVIFAQVAFLGLRPALAERKRLGEAQAVLEQRFQRDVALRDEIAANLHARSDPIFNERQRRLRQGPPLALK